jgi:hypothetical protein
MHNLALAVAAKPGYIVTGSDDEIFDPARTHLKEAGLLPAEAGWFPEKITADLDAVILGMHAREDNPELIKARELGLKIYSFPEYLYEQTKDKIRIVVGGSHGKTTTTSMILYVLNKLGIEADYMVGAQIEGFERMVRLSETATYAVFEGDEYLTRHSDFTTEVSTTADFVNKQSADGGGDYPEAVRTALDRMLKDLSWDSSARTRLAFLILDAPAHHETAVIRSLQQSVQACAQRGIRLIPVSASGVDKNTEFMLRFYAIVTGGTYVFLTNDSGVGLPHIQATVGDYEVEQLNRLLIRLIKEYTE